MTGQEKLALLSLAGAYSLRMLGLYIVLPILSPYASGLPGGATFWVGMAVGSYGLAQAVFQMPFGALSDHLGRRRAILIGLGLFAVGSLIAAEARTAPVLVVGRIVQGVGAISSVVVAAVADITSEGVRQRAMSLLGVSIGLTFAVGIVGGPVLAGHIGVPGLFFLSVGLALLSMASMVLLVPEPRVSTHQPRPTFRQTLGVLHDVDLVRINGAMLALHLGITAVFVVLPLQIERFVPRTGLWKVYGPAIVTGLVGLLATAELVDRFRAEKKALMTGALLLAAGSLLIRGGYEGHGALLWGLMVFVLGFAVVEPILPALVTHYAGTSVRGTAAGAFSMSQFLGAGIGGLVGAFFLAHGEKGLFILLALLALLILGLAATLPDPRRLQILELEAIVIPPREWPGLHHRLVGIRGVRDAVYDPVRSVLGVKYMTGQASEAAVRGSVSELLEGDSPASEPAAVRTPTR